MYSKIVKFCSVILTVALLINLLPMQVLGEEVKALSAEPENASSNVIYDNELVTSSDATIIGEVVDKRTEFSKEYKLSNGLHMTAVYPRAVHFENNGKWDEIDNTLKVVGSGTNIAYINTAGSWNVSFPQTLTGEKTVSVSKGGYALSFGMAGELRTASSGVIGGEVATMGTTKNGEVSEIYSVSSVQSATAQIHHATATRTAEVEYAETISTKTDSRVTYQNVYSNTNIIYDLQSNELKETIILGSYDATLRGYRYTLNTATLVPVLNDDNSIHLYSADMQDIIFTMPAPFMIDNAGEYCGDIDVTLTGTRGVYTLSYFLPVAWLAEEERSWPVVLDPVITEHSSQENIQDQTVTEEQVPDPSTGVLQLGWRQDWGNMRFFMKFNEIPELTSADVVVHAEIGLYKAQTSNTTVPVTVHKVKGDWTEDTITWSNKPAFDTTIEDCYLSKTVGMHYWDVTDIVRGWYETGNNFGMMFKVVDQYENLTSNNFRQYYSPDYSAHPTDLGLYPGLWVTFRNNNGLESYFDYTASSAGRAGTGYVNNYSGNLTWVHNDIGFDGNRMPVSISHVYNTNDSARKIFGLGYGWRTNFNQLVGIWSEDNSYYFWEDGDGTTHYFKLDTEGTYKDEDGLQLTLTVASGKATITDKNGNKSYFDTQGRLYKMENNQATKSNISITYVGATSKRISKITDGAGRVYNFTYTDNLLNRISYVGKGTTELSYVAFAYSSSRLTSITDKDGKSSVFTYGSTNLLTKAQDVDGYKLQYSYSAGTPKRVIKIREYDGTVAGGHMTIKYAHNQTTLTDHNSNVQILQFNDWGNLVATQDDQGRAQYALYSRNKYDDNTSKANQMRLSSKMQNTVSNLFANSSFEESSIWTCNASSVTVSRSTAAAYLGKYSLKLVGTVTSKRSGAYSPILSVGAGETITFSAYIKTVSAAAALGIKRLSDSTVFDGEVVAAGKDWQRYQMSFTNTSDATVKIRCYIFVRDAGTIYMDCAQAEYAPTASRYNIIENGDFRFGSNSWIMSDYCDSNETSVTLSASAAPQLDTTAFRIVGDPTHKLRIRQEVPVSGVKGDTFVLAGWAKGNGVPLVDRDANHRTFTVRGTFMYTDDTTGEFNFDFNPDAGNYWQYRAGVMVATKPFDGIKIQVLYDFGANTIYFDGIQLFKETFGTSYTYDSNGNVTSVVDLQNEKTTYQYSSNNLTKILKDNKAQMRYVYDNYHNVTKAITQTEDADGNIVNGIVYQFTYDTYGNNTSVKVTSGGKTIRSSATYTADGNRLLTTKDTLDKVTTYCYNENTNMLESVQYPNDAPESKTTYTYDALYRIATASAAVAGLSEGTALTVNYTYDGDYLTEIRTPSTTYELYYGNFGMPSGVSIGDRWLALYEYTDDKNRDLSAIEYGNRQINIYRYDAERRLIKELLDNGTTVDYTYDNTGALSSVTDSETGRTTTYYYDLIGRIGNYTEVGQNYEHSVAYTYDERNNLSRLAETINGAAHVTDYTYDYENRIKTVTVNGITRTYTYDAYGRMTRMEDTQGGNSVQTIVYTYHDTAERASTRIATMRTTRGTAADVTYTYTYDDNGNILSVSDGTNTTSYTYDTANQLIRENNQGAGKTWTWVYDNAGNITSRKEYAYTTGDLGTTIDMIPYTYSDATWGDLLTAYDGSSRTYDDVGNLWTDGTWTYTWQNGRELASMTDGTATWSYTYDANGMRTQRSNSTTAYNYVYNGSTLSQMTVDGNTLNFAYDAGGVPMTVNYNGTNYYYIVNLQGDVTGITNSSGTLVVSYTYDAWGKPLSVTGSMAATLGTLNPLRYRGYVYDTETGLYYLESRYYDPEIGRFINADNVIAGVDGSIQGYNMYAYCFNNPVNMSDSSGHWPQWIQGTANWVKNNIIQPVACSVKDIVEDINNYDSSNQSEEKVLESNYFSSYKGLPVIRTNGDRSGFFGAIFLTRETNSRSNPEDVLRHEYGHSKQWEQLGVINYALCIGLPSWQEWGTGEYYSKPWEITADIYGNVQSRNHSQSNIDRGFAYLEGSKLLGPFIWMFIE